MMIGEGGTSCTCADDGIEITEADKAAFVKTTEANETEYDFKNETKTSSKLNDAYSLNLQIS